MDREQAKALLPIMQAYSEGKTIQFLKPDSDEWRDVLRNENNEINFEDLARYEVCYRVKPEPKCRPFKNAEECWAEMLKHTPFGWVESLKSNAMYEIQCLKRGGGGKIYSYDDIFFSNFEEFFKGYKFADGTPFGVRENF